jgi:chromate transporter
MPSRILLALFWVFAPLSLISVGGGQSVVVEMHRQAVQVHGWVTDQTFTTDWALARLAPGPGSLLVSLIGWQAAGFAGAAVATLAMFLPSSALVCALAHVWSRPRGARAKRAVERGLMPVAAGMILATTYTLLRAAEGGWLLYLVTCAVAAVLLSGRGSPLALLPIGAGLFIVLQP